MSPVKALTAPNLRPVNVSAVQMDALIKGQIAAVLQPLLEAITDGRAAEPPASTDRRAQTGRHVISHVIRQVALRLQMETDDR